MDATIQTDQWLTAAMLLAAFVAAGYTFWRSTDTPASALRRRTRRKQRRDRRQARRLEQRLRRRVKNQQARADQIIERARQARERSQGDPDIHPQ
ncbi:hypothetical protein ACQEVF_59640 [Nonomuraea polychroma]|uniref:hypothetical protein n=1 Tax=Nonomuraea polychroma TaxID=46176 RepID=UPI003D8EFD94